MRLTHADIDKLLIDACFARYDPFAAWLKASGPFQSFLKTLHLNVAY
jgi:hypothetical protein